MRHLLKSFIITIATVYITFSLVPTINFGPDPKNILFFVGGLWILSQIINPVFSIVLLPINLITLGLVSLILNIAFVFALLNFLPGFTIDAYNFPGGNIYDVILPQIDFNKIMTIGLVAVIITILLKAFHLVFE